MEKGYLIVDIGTGNARVAIVSTAGKIISIQTTDVPYQKDSRYPDAVSFDPEKVVLDIQHLIEKTVSESPNIKIEAVLSTSQREGIVLIDEHGNALTGLPNIDNRGKEWESEITNFKAIYEKTGRWPTTVFSALKLRGLKDGQPDLWERIATFTSISDWIGYKFTDQLGYENSQASETLLFDVRNNQWSKELCDLFGVDFNWLPTIRKSGTILGYVSKKASQLFTIKEGIPFIVGGADTQLAVKEAQPEIDDIVLVSGTTTPIVKVVSDYLVDDESRCWVNRHVNEKEYIIETNAGVSGLNYQRLKKVFFPDKTYEEIEKEVLALEDPKTIASFGTFVFDKQLPLEKGGFYMDAPAHHELTAADFVFGIIFDIACSIKYNFDVLLDISPSSTDYVLACGGGFKGTVLPQMLADLLCRRIIIKEGYDQASIMGGVIICNETLGVENKVKESIKTFKPTGNLHYHKLYEKWHHFRSQVNVITSDQGGKKHHVN